MPGKTLYAGRRRAMTRTSGFQVHADTTGGEFRRHLEHKLPLQAGEAVQITFSIAQHNKGDLLGFGVWFWRTAGVVCAVRGGPERRTLTEYAGETWNKAGSIWTAQDSAPVDITFSLTATASDSSIALYAPMCGRIHHKHLDNARPELMRNMYQFAPEALFIDEDDAGAVNIEAPSPALYAEQPLILKSCNRCGRYLPVNVPEERDQLSFSNHCVADHRRPCKHATFGKLRVQDGNEILQLDYGYQLECRFCKKFEVNAAHNPQRTSAQMKEDGARRRAFELLLAELYEGTPQLRYRHEYGTELADDVWRRFGRACFNCGAKLATARQMHLDHTRPLALLWPLDGTATALCGSCNSEKRDRSPSSFYTPAKLKALAKITGVSQEDLAKTHPNDEALGILLRRLDWFFGDFLLRSEMTKERDGKVAGELVVKALQKVLARSEQYSRIDLQGEYDRRRAPRR